jgi:hypothetical protein
MAILTPPNTGAQQELLTSERARCVDFITRRPEFSLGSLPYSLNNSHVCCEEQVEVQEMDRLPLNQQRCHIV